MTQHTRRRKVFLALLLTLMLTVQYVIPSAYLVARADEIIAQAPANEPAEELSEPAQPPQEQVAAQEPAQPADEAPEASGDEAVEQLGDKAPEASDDEAVEQPGGEAPEVSDDEATEQPGGEAPETSGDEATEQPGGEAPETSDDEATEQPDGEAPEAFGDESTEQPGGEAPEVSDDEAIEQLGDKAPEASDNEATEQPDGEDAGISEEAATVPEQRAPMAVDSLTGVEITLTGEMAADESGLLPIAAEVTFSWAPQDEGVAGDYSVVKLPGLLIGLADASGALDGGAGTWAVNAARYELTFTFAQDAVVPGAQGRFTLLAQLDAQAMLDQGLDALTFEAEGGKAFQAWVALFAARGVMPLDAEPPKQVKSITDIKFYQNSKEVGVGDLDRIQTGPDNQIGVRFFYAFTEEERLLVNPGDYTLVKLPGVFPLFNNDGQLTGGGGSYGTWEADGHDLKLIFNENISQSAVSGYVELWFYLDEDKLNNQTELPLPFDVGDPFTKYVKLDPKVSETLSKGGAANGKTVTWTVDVNKKLESISGASLQDTLGPGHKLVPGSIQIHHLTVGLNGSVTPGAEVTGITPDTTETSFTVNLGSIDSAYRITYQSVVDSWAVTEAENTAVFSTHRVTERVAIPTPAPITKHGEANASYNAASINWQVSVNQDERTLQKPVVTDTLPAGTEVVPGTVKVYNGAADVTGSFSITYPQGKIVVTANSEVDYAYRIEYTTNIVETGTPPKKPESFNNRATLTHGDDPALDAWYTVRNKRGTSIQKSGSLQNGSNYQDKYVNWTIDYNTAEQSVTGTITDTVGAGLAVPDTVDVYPLTASVDSAGNLSWTEGAKTTLSVSKSGSGFTIELNSGAPVSGAYRIKYQTPVTDVNAESFRNAASGGPGVGTGDITVGNTLAPQFAKETPSIDYQNQTITWKLTIRPVKEALEGVTIDDTFSSGMVFVGGSDVMSPAGTLYTLTPKAGGTGFTVTFNQALSGSDYVLTYQTKLNYELTDPAQIADEYINTAIFKWTGGPNAGETRQDKRTIERRFEVNGSKSGSFNKDTGLITWEILVNPLSKNLGSVPVTDTAGPSQTIVHGVTVQTATIAADGSIADRQLAETPEVTYSSDDTSFSLTLPNVTQPYVITYQSRVNGLRLNKYTNTAVVKGVPYTGEVTYNQYNDYIKKESAPYAEGSKVIDWKVTINSAKSEIPNAKLIDTIGTGHYLDESSVVVKKAGTPVTDYTISVGAPDLATRTQVFTIAFGHIDDEYTITYQTKVTAEGRVTLSNSVRLTGVDDADELGNTSSGRQIFVTGGTGTGTGELGILKIIKIDALTKEAVKGASFTLYRRSGNVYIGQGTTDENGILLIAGLNYGTYDIREIIAPEGYVIMDATDSVVIDAGTLNGGVVEKIIQNQPTQVAISKAGITGGEELPGATLRVMDGDTIIEEWVSGTTPYQINAKLIAGKAYILVEETAPDGYIVAESISITVNEDGTPQTVTMQDDWTKVTISKLGITGGEELPGATLKVMDGDTIIEEWVSGTTPHQINAKLIAGKTYTLVEETAPDGYIVAEAISFTVNEDGTPQTVTMQDDWTKVTISKAGITGGEELPGATLKVMDGDTIIEEWVSGTTPHQINAKLIAGKTYTLVEETAPDGYIVAESISFTVNGDGTPQTVTMQDDWTKVTISKLGITGGEELPGATLRVMDGDTVIEEWVSGTTPHQINAKLIAGKTYTLVEETAPDGYIIAEAIDFTVNKDGAPQTVTMQDDWTKLTISKVGITGGEELSGATLRVMDGDTVIEEWMSGTTPHAINARLVAGKTYTLVEETAPEGYVIAEAISFTVNEDGTPQTVTMQDDWTKVTISKVGITGGEELPGATLRVMDGDTVIEEWVSGTTPHAINARLVAGKAYTLVEETVPDGYVVAEAISFTVNEDGTPQTVTMQDDWTKVTISKVAITGGPELPGARLKLMDGDAIIEEWVSGTAPRQINAKLLAGKTYTLIEETAPNGYVVAEAITFRVSTDGSVDQVEMLDKPTDVSISKRRMTGTSELTGATLKLVDADGNLIESWVSGKEPHRLVAKLTAGARYTLIEERAPKGYQTAKPITFTVNTDGTPQTIIMRDMRINTDSQTDPGKESGVPKTGDDAELTLWLAILVGSMLLLSGAAVLLFKKRRA